MTADVLDAAQEIEQRILDAKLEAMRQASAPRALNPKLSCYWCSEPFEQGSEKLFCDSECSEDYNKYERQR